jgi:hypothetical protein
MLISTLGKIIYYKGTFFKGSTKPQFTTQNRLEATAEKNFFDTRLHSMSSPFPIELQ